MSGLSNFDSFRAGVVGVRTAAALWGTASREFLKEPETIYLGFILAIFEIILTFLRISLDYSVDGFSFG